VSASTAGRVARFALAYFASVFSIGFVLGAARTLWIAPRLGERVAELVEMPVMVAASFLVARALMSRTGAVGIRAAVLAGLAALALLLCAEVAVVAFVRGQTLAEYVASRDPVAGSAYILALLLFAAMPALVSHRRAVR
jgi:low temperature requirement protein LtrA